MSILTANLKHLYQRRAVWFWHFLILCQMPMILMPPFLTKLDRYLGYLIASLLTGILVGALQKDILIKPFSFCLPGHRYITRPFVFWIGGIVNLILGCVFWGYPELDFGYIILVVLAAGLLGMIVYFYGVYIGFSELPSLAGGLIPLFIFGAIFFKWDKSFQGIIINQPILVISASTVVCVWVWRLLGRDFLARKYCGKLAIVGFFDNWGGMFDDIAKARKYPQALANQKPNAIKAILFENLHGFFLHRMGQCDFLSRGRYTWGNLYVAFGKHFGYWQLKNVLGFLALIVFFLLVAGFWALPNAGPVNFLFVLPVFAVLSLDILPYRSMLFPAGRTDKYFSSLVLAIVITLSAGLLILAVTGLSIFLEMSLPEFSFRGKMFSYQGMDTEQFYTYFLFMPVALSLSAISFRSNLLKIGFPIAFMSGWMGAEMASTRSLVDIIGPMGVSGLIALCWIGFLVILHYICMRRSLVGQGG